MKRIILISLACMCLIVSSCGYVDRQTKMRIRGTVVEKETGEPIQGAYLDIADNDEMLRLVLHPKHRTGGDGTFNALYTYKFYRHIFMLIPVGGDPEVPERLLIEVTKDGYAPKIIAVEPQQLERDNIQAYLIGKVELHKD